MAASGRRFFCLAIVLALDAGQGAAQDLDAGKSGPQLFASSCAGCHRSARQLAQRTQTWSLSHLSLSYFLREHYTTSRTSANELAAYLNSLGGDDRRKHGRATRAGEPLIRPAPPPGMFWWDAPLRPPAAIPNR